MLLCSPFLFAAGATKCGEFGGLAPEAVVKSLAAVKAEEEAKSRMYQTYLAPGKLLSTKAFSWMVKGSNPHIPRASFESDPAEAAATAWALMKLQFDVSFLESEAAGNRSEMKAFEEEIARRAKEVGVTPKEFLALSKEIAAIAAKEAKLAKAGQEHELVGFMREHLPEYALLLMDRDAAKRAAGIGSPKAALMTAGAGAAYGLGYDMMYGHGPYLTFAGVAAGGLVQLGFMARGAIGFAKSYIKESRMRGKFKKGGVSETAKAIADHYHIEEGTADELAAQAIAQSEYESKHYQFPKPEPVTLAGLTDGKILSMGSDVDEAASQFGIDVTHRVERMLDPAGWAALEGALGGIMKTRANEPVKKTAFKTAMTEPLRRQIQILTGHVQELERMMGDAEALDTALRANPLLEVPPEELTGSANALVLAFQNRVGQLDQQIQTMRTNSLGLSEMQANLQSYIAYLSEVQNSLNASGFGDVNIPKSTDDLLDGLNLMVRSRRQGKPLQAIELPSGSQYAPPPIVAEEPQTEKAKAKAKHKVVHEE
jgi:hypothetical protein